MAITIDEFRILAGEAIDEFESAYDDIQARDGKRAYPNKQSKDEWWQLFVDFMAGNEPFDELEDDEEEDEDDEDEDDEEEE